VEEGGGDSCVDEEMRFLDEVLQQSKGATVTAVTNMTGKVGQKKGDRVLEELLAVDRS
jgi:hypothetical protein